MAKTSDDVDGYVLSYVQLLIIKRNKTQKQHVK